MESIHEGATLPRGQCDNKTQEKEKLKRHVESIHADEKCPCSQCEKTFEKKEKLKRHVECIHEGETQPVACNQESSTSYPCNQCDMKCENNICLKKHIGVDHDQKELGNKAASVAKDHSDKERIGSLMIRGNRAVGIDEKVNDNDWSDGVFESFHREKGAIRDVGSTTDKEMMEKQKMQTDPTNVNQDFPSNYSKKATTCDVVLKETDSKVIINYEDIPTLNNMKSNL